MIVRNNGATLERALEPFVGQVDEISIVLGGPSDDNTPEIAARYADVLSQYEGEFLFGPARQQAYDQLSTDWAITVDGDEIWDGAANLRTVINDAPDEVAVVTVRITSGDWCHEWTQSRVHRRACGKWIGAIHEFWRADKGYFALFSNDLSVHQPGKNDPVRAEQNISIARRWLEEHPGDLRTMAHLGRDLAAKEQFNEALAITADYMAVFKTIPEEERDWDQYFGMRFNQGAIELELKMDEALEHALDGLMAADYGAGWTLMAENFQRRALQAHDPRALGRLAIFCAEQAIAAGKTRSARGYSKNVSSVMPFMIKAQACEALGRLREAVQALDMVLWLEPGHGEAKSFRETLCRKVGMVP